MRVNAMIVAIFMLGAFVTCSSSSERDTADKTGGDNWTVTLSGKVQNPQPQGTITLSELGPQGATGTASTITLGADNTFKTTVTLTEPGYYRLNFYDRQVVNLILYKDDVQVTVDGSDMNGTAEIKGSSDIDFIYKANDILKGIQDSPEAAKLNQEFEVARQAGDETKMRAIQDSYFAMVRDKQAELAKLIEQQPPSLGVINLLQNNALDKDDFFKTYEVVATKLKKEWPDYSHAQDFIKLVDGMKATAVGQPAPEISLPNPDGQVVKLSSMQGQYVLVDFWAKWCGPCRAENPNVVRVYNKYKDKGFTVYGVSLDRNREDWLKAIKDDGLTWTHVSDLKYWNSEAARTYNINAIPFSLLLDPNGVIIAKNLRGPALEAKLAEIFAGK